MFDLEHVYSYLFHSLVVSFFFLHVLYCWLCFSDVKESGRSFAIRSELQGPNPVVAAAARLPLVHLTSKR